LADQQPFLQDSAEICSQVSQKFIYDLTLEAFIIPGQEMFITFIEANNDSVMKTKSINQTVTLEASPLDVYNLIMDSKKHSVFTGSDVKMSNTPEGKFEVFDGYVHGYNIELC